LIGRPRRVFAAASNIIIIDIAGSKSLSIRGCQLMTFTPRSSYPTGQMFQPIHTDNDQETLSQETILKIEELKRLVYRYPQYHRNPDAVIKCATYWSINGDNKVLDEILEKLRMISNFMR
jgi:hypothetical protein